MQVKKIDLWVGVFVLIGMISVVMLTLSVGAKGWGNKTPTYRVTAKFAGIGTLKIDAPVKMTGIEIGRVRAIELVDDGGVYKAQVTMDIQSKVKLPMDSQVMVYTAGLLGAQFVGINQGNDAQNLVKDGGELTETEQAMQLEDLIKNFGVKQAESEAASGK